MSRWIVDGMNVIGAGAGGWWRDRPAAMRELAQRLATFAAANDEPLTVIFDGSEPEGGLAAEGIEVRFAPGGPGSADEQIAELVAADPEPGELCVVTSDRELAGQVGELGAAVVGAGGFRARLEEAGRSG